MKKITHKGAEVHLVAHVNQMYFRFIGPSTPIDAIWAHLNSTEVRKRGWTNLADIRLEESTKYKRIIQRLPSGLLDVVIIHPSGLISWPYHDFIMVVEDGQDSEIPPGGFFKRLASKLFVPLLEEWTSTLWEKGLETDGVYDKPWDHSKLIEVHNGEGVTVYQAHTSPTETWEKIVQNIIKKGG